ncbi:MAG: hypothetical protein PHC61_10570 [Chitinivibrionales bacterium]|nr:hypothetical protein [Chitinivibrionales bacterium]
MKIKIVLGYFLMLVLGCSTNNPTQFWALRDAKIQVAARIRSGPQLGKLLATIADSLVITVAAGDMDTLRVALKINQSNPTLADTALSIPSGKNRRVGLQTKNDNGIVHTGDHQTISLEPGETKSLSFWLTPCKGSIYLSLIDIPTAADSVFARFLADTGAFSAGVKVKRSSAKTYLSLDNIPDNTAGTLTIVALGAARDTLYRSSQHLVYRVAGDTTLSMSSMTISGGALDINATIGTPGATLVKTSLSGGAASAERGGCIITEIMYAVDDSEYIELYNPGDRDTTFDTLIIDKDGVFRPIPHLAFKAHGFVVIGRKALPWADAWPGVQSALDLSSTSGNWLAVRAKDSTVLDQVAFAAGNNSQEWPALGSAKKSIVLDSLCDDPAYNNYGKHWRAAQSPINPAITLQYGTPGRSGL